MSQTSRCRLSNFQTKKVDQLCDVTTINGDVPRTVDYVVLCEKRGESRKSIVKVIIFQSQGFCILHSVYKLGLF